MSETSGRGVKRTAVALGAWMLLLAGRSAVQSPARAAGGHGALDGKSFVGSTGPQGKAADGKETIVFADGRFRSLACDPYGFGDADYTTTTAADGALRFHAVTKSAKQGTIEWDGVVRAGKLDATFVWTTKKGEAIPYWAKASEKVSGKIGHS